MDRPITRRQAQTVCARKYRFRVVNGANASVHRLGLSSRRPLVQIATDLGLLGLPSRTPASRSRWRSGAVGRGWPDARLTVFYQRRHVESAQRFPDAPMLTPAYVEALDLFDASRTTPT